MSDSRVPSAAEDFKRLLDLNRHAEFLQNKLRLFQEKGYGSTELFEDLENIRQKIRNMLLYYCCAAHRSLALEVEIQSLGQQVRSIDLESNKE